MLAAEKVKTSNVLLVEDHGCFRETLACTLDREPGLSVAAQVETLAQGCEALEGIDVAIVDLGLPDGDGVELLRKLRRVNRRCRVLVLTASIDPAQLANAVEAGAAMVMHKSACLAEIVDAVRSLGEGEIRVSQETHEILRTAIRSGRWNCRARRETEHFTQREGEVLQALAEGLENEEIARKLDMTVRTVRAHMAHIFNKLGAHSRLEAFVLAVRYGAIAIR